MKLPFSFEDVEKKVEETNEKIEESSLGPIWDNLSETGWSSEDVAKYLSDQGYEAIAADFRSSDYGRGVGGSFLVKMLKGYDGNPRHYFKLLSPQITDIEVAEITAKLTNLLPFQGYFCPSVSPEMNPFDPDEEAELLKQFSDPNSAYWALNPETPERKIVYWNRTAMVKKNRNDVDVEVGLEVGELKEKDGTYNQVSSTLRIRTHLSLQQSLIPSFVRGIL